MTDQTPHTEMCSCASEAVVRIHGKGTYCGDAQHERLADRLAEQLLRDIEHRGNPNAENAASAALDALRKEPAPVPDDITLLNQAQASIFRSLCDHLMSASAGYGYELGRSYHSHLADALISAGLVHGPGTVPQPAAEPEPCVITDAARDKVRVTSLRGPGLISLDVTDVVWLTPDQADQLADALKAHAAARRADEPGGGAQ